MIWKDDAPFSETNGNFGPDQTIEARVIAANSDHTGKPALQMPKRDPSEMTTPEPYGHGIENIPTMSKKWKE
jgi:hypothetical protein